MPTKQIQENAKVKMEKTKDALRADLMAIRAGRANPQLLERITVDYYGAQTPLTQMGNITAPEPRMLVINLWDQKSISLVEKAILKSEKKLLAVIAKYDGMKGATMPIAVRGLDSADCPTSLHLSTMTLPFSPTSHSPAL